MLVPNVPTVGGVAICRMNTASKAPDFEMPSAEGGVVTMLMNRTPRLLASFSIYDFCVDPTPHCPVCILMGWSGQDGS